MPPRPRSGRGPEIEVLRIGHRPGRDPRLTTHLALAARALGATVFHLHPPDAEIAERIRAVNRRWGNGFEVRGTEDWRGVVRGFDGVVVHLTMYGRPVARALPRLRRAKRVLAIVGGAKVPPALYSMADANVAVGNQPHSEVAALAVLLALLRGTDAPGRRPGAELVIVPMARGKRVRTVRARRSAP